MESGKSWEAHARIRRERATIGNMIGIYCEGNHGGEGLCTECRGLLEYASARLAVCLHAEDKPTCSNCSTHCYAVARREQIKAVMRYSGPRMLFSHPIQALSHMLDEITH